MQNYASTGPLVAANGDSHQLIATDLRNLIARIDNSMRLIEAAMMHDAGGDETGSVDVVVLDDVTPRYATASAALGACKAGLNVALQTWPCISGPAKSDGF